MIENQQKITEIYTEQSYDELKEVLNNYLNPTDENTTTGTSTTTETTKTEPVLEGTTKTADVDSAFDELFNN